MMADASSATPASDALRAEHRLIEAQLDRLEHAIKNAGTAVMEDIRGAVAAIGSLSRSHFMKEEEVLYPALRERWPELLAQLDAEHNHAREIESHLDAVLASLRAQADARSLDELRRFALELVDVIQHHIVAEEDQLLRLADERLSADAQSELAARMALVSAS
jgi:hemerythrin-like domain-containing protein